MPPHQGFGEVLQPLGVVRSPSPIRFRADFYVTVPVRPPIPIRCCAEFHTERRRVRYGIRRQVHEIPKDFAPAYTRTHILAESESIQILLMDLKRFVS